MLNELDMAGQACEIIKAIANEQLRVVSFYVEPNYNPCGFYLEVKVERNCWCKFYMESGQVVSVTEVIDPHDRRLIGRHNPITVMGLIDGPTAAKLEEVLGRVLAQNPPI